MRSVHVADGLKLRFPGRGEEFAEGAEIGVLAALMSLPLQEFSRPVSTKNIDQVRCLAAKLGFAISESEAAEGPQWTLAAFRYRPAALAAPASVQASRAHLRLVSARG